MAALDSIWALSLDSAPGFRPIIGYHLWRHVTVLTLVLYSLVTLHGIFASTGTRTWWPWPATWAAPG